MNAERLNYLFQFMPFKSRFIKIGFISKLLSYLARLAFIKIIDNCNHFRTPAIKNVNHKLEYNVAVKNTYFEIITFQTPFKLYCLCICDLLIANMLYRNIKRKHTRHNYDYSGPTYIYNK